MDLLPSNEETGRRFRIASGMLTMGRKDFCEKHSLNQYTVQSWEIGRNNLNAQMVARFCEALSAEGIFCSHEWLIKGKGSVPIKLSARQDLPVEAHETERQQYIQNEIKLFRDNKIKLGLEPIVIELGDQAMKPYFNKGDYVGGYSLPERSIETLLGQIAIIGIGSENYVVRRLMKEGTNYLLVPADFTERVVSLKKLETVAKIVWHRI